MLRIESGSAPYDGISDADIFAAENYGLLEGLRRHMVDKSIVQIARIAVELMEAVHARGCREKVWFFVRLYGEALYSAIPDPAERAEFAIRVGKMGNERIKAIWCSEGCRLLANEAVAGRVSQATLTTLASLFAQVGNLDYTLRYLLMGEATRNQFSEAATSFFERGEFQKGLAVLNSGPPLLPATAFTDKYTSEDFTELLGYAFTHREILGDTDYQNALISTVTDIRKKYIVLDALCFLGHKEKAQRYAIDMSLHHRTISPLLSLFKHFEVHSPERLALFEKTHKVAIYLENQRGQSTFGYYELSACARSEALTHSEAMVVCYSIPMHSISNLIICGERACWGYQIRKRKEKHDLDDLRVTLHGMRRHRVRCPLAIGEDILPIGCKFSVRRLNMAS